MKTILIVDDHPSVIRVLRLGVEQAGYRVETAGNGIDCLARLGAALPDFMVTDIDMPRMGGKQLCLTIQTEFPERKFPIVVLTSRTELEHRDWTTGIDNLSFMEKPVSIRRLLAEIEARIGAVDNSEVA